ncbi:MAG TPA: hypothetical protein VMS60_00535 [Solirubrobacterales bacterium]|nr:hypothetical protein [Solirubrobacterales bacterium]
MARRWGKLCTALATALASAALFAPAAPAAGPPNVLVVGDSLEELTAPYLERYLRGVPVTINAVGGSNSYEIFDLFEESYDPSQTVIVFDAGTNDNPNYPQILAENLQKVEATVGNRCLVVPTIHGYTVEGTDNSGKNQTVIGFAASRPGTQVPDWAGAIAADPGLLQSDGLHPTPEGADYRAQLIAQGVLACLSYAQTVVPPSAPGPAIEATRMQLVSRVSDRAEALERRLEEGAMRRAARQTFAQILQPGS